MIKELVFVL